MICKLFVYYIIFVHEHVTEQVHATKNSNKTPFYHSVLILYFTFALRSLCLHVKLSFLSHTCNVLHAEANVVTLKYVSCANRHPAGNRPVRLFRGNLVPYL